MNKSLFVSALTIFCSIFFSVSASQPEHSLQTKLDQIREEYNLPGISAAIVYDDGQQIAAFSGFADLESKTPLASRPRMLGASTGKSFVGALATTLVLEQKLSLDEPIAKWLGDEAWFVRLPNHELITLRHLLNHTAGLEDHVHLDGFQERLSNDPDWNPEPEKLINFILDNPALFVPGNGWSYSDTGYLLIGLIIERATKQTYYELLYDYFLQPVGLEDTSPSNRKKLENLATGYTDPENPFSFPVSSLDSEGTLAWNPSIEWTGGGLVTTALDLAIWSSAIFSINASRPDLRTLLLDSVAIDSQQPELRYGAGVVKYPDRGNGGAVGHYGWIPGYVSSFRYYPQQAVSIAFQINTDIGLVNNDLDIPGQINEKILAVSIRN